uniref:Uncharacterized protein n=1 Tax=Xiangshan picorna-like virus 7 TaxID=2886223 RepID=A0A8K1P3I5_9VIRU|nr:MAG: hypothetical protein [Xiangshan picorna-like virus 7]
MNTVFSVIKSILANKMSATNNVSTRRPRVPDVPEETGLNRPVGVGVHSRVPTPNEKRFLRHRIWERVWADLKEFDTEFTRTEFMDFNESAEFNLHCEYSLDLAVRNESEPCDCVKFFNDLVAPTSQIYKLELRTGPFPLDETFESLFIVNVHYSYPQVAVVDCPMYRVDETDCLMDGNITFHSSLDRVDDPIRRIIIEELLRAHSRHPSLYGRKCEKQSSKPQPPVASTSGAAEAPSGIKPPLTVPGMDITVDNNKVIDLSGSPEATLVDLNALTTLPMPESTGAPFDKKLQLYSTPSEHTTIAVTADQAMGAQVLTMSNKLSSLGPEHQVWAKAHRYWIPQTIHNIGVQGTEGLVGSIILGWVPDITKTYTIPQLKLVNHVVIALNGQSQYKFLINDIRNKQFNRPVAESEDTEPYPGIIALVYEPVQNKFAAGKFSINIHHDSWFGPGCCFFAPYGSIAPVTSSLSEGDILSGTSRLMPYEARDRLNFVVNDHIIPFNKTTTRFKTAPRLRGLFSNYDADLISQGNKGFYVPVSVKCTGVNLNIPITFAISGDADEDILSALPAYVEKAKNAKKGGIPEKIVEGMTQAFNDLAVTASMVSLPTEDYSFLEVPVEKSALAIWVANGDPIDTITKSIEFQGKWVPMSTGGGQRLLWHIATNNASFYLFVIWTDQKVDVDHTPGELLKWESATTDKKFPWLPLSVEQYVVGREGAAALVGALKGLAYYADTSSTRGSSEAVLQVQNTISSNGSTVPNLMAFTVETEVATTLFSSKLANAIKNRAHYNWVKTFDAFLAQSGSQVASADVCQGVNILCSIVYSKTSGFCVNASLPNRVLTGVDPATIVLRNFISQDSQMVKLTDTSSWSDWISTPVHTALSQVRAAPCFKQMQMAASLGIGAAAGLFGGLADGYWKQKQMDLDKWKTEGSWQNNQALQQMRNDNTKDVANLQGTWNLRNTSLSYSMQGENQRALSDRNLANALTRDKNTFQQNLQYAGLANSAVINTGVGLTGPASSVGSDQSQAMKPNETEASQDLEDAPPSTAPEIHTALLKTQDPIK